MRVLAKLARPAPPTTHSSHTTTTHSSRPPSSLTSSERERPHSGMDLSPLMSHRPPSGGAGSIDAPPNVTASHGLPPVIRDHRSGWKSGGGGGGEVEVTSSPSPWTSDGVVMSSSQLYSGSSTSTPLTQRYIIVCVCVANAVLSAPTLLIGNPSILFLSFSSQTTK